MGLAIIVTNAGRAALVNATNTGTDPVTIAQVGLSAIALVPSPAATALPGEFKRLATLSGDVVADDMIHLIVRDEGLDVFTVRSLALYLADGTLFAIYGQADVLVEKSSQSMLLLAIDVKFEDVDAATLTFGDANFLNPPATTEQQGVVELATTAEAQAGIDALRALTPAAAKAAILGWLLAQDGSGSGLDADLLDGKDASAFGLLDGSTTFTGPLRVIAGNQALFKQNANSNPTVIHRMDGNNYYILLSDPGTGISQTYNALRPFRIDAISGVVTSANGQVFSGGMTVSGSLTLNGAGVWSSGNDGAGSGLDADLLDGQDGSYYSNITARLGYTPANKAGDTFTGPIRRDSGFYMDLSGGKPMLFFADDLGGADRIEFDRATNSFLFNLAGLDIAKFNGSGLNVLTGDLVIGRTSTAWGYLVRPNVAGYKNLQFAVEGGGSLDNLELNALNVTIRTYTAWHAGNDGAGSGLDADLLDGQQGSYYSDIVARLGYTPLNKAGGTMTGRLGLSGAGLHVATKNDITTRVDSGFWQADTATIAEGWPLDSNNWFHLITSSHSNEENYYSMQFAGSFYNSSDIFYRATAGNGAAAWNRLWNSANDGAGSGLDSDLLDGQQGSYYTDIVARLGYTPLNTTGYTAADVKAKLLTVDGAGSGVDADLLDGQEGSYYSNVTARLGYTPVRQGGGAGQGTNTIYIGWSGFRLKAQVDSTDQGNIVFDSHISDVWRSSNDGAGSGLDADLLDGQQGSYYLAAASYTAADVLTKLATVDGAGSGLDADLLDGFQAADFLRDVGVDFSEQGYLKLSNGLILQWGTAAGTYSANVNVQVNFPITFPNQILHVGGGNGDVQAQGNAVVGINYTTPPNTTRFYFRTNVAGQNRCNWIAIGR